MCGKCQPSHFLITIVLFDPDNDTLDLDHAERPPNHGQSHRVIGEKSHSSTKNIEFHNQSCMPRLPSCHAAFLANLGAARNIEGLSVQKWQEIRFRNGILAGNPQS